MNDEDEGGKNLAEEELFKAQLKSMGETTLRTSYTKVVNNHAGLELVNNMHNLLTNDLNVIVYNFFSKPDAVANARTSLL